MALSSNVYQWISQQGLTRLIDATTGPEGPHGVTSSWLVPSGGWINGQRVPHVVQTELEGEKFPTTKQEGIDYFLVPEESTNLPGRIAHYAQATGVADLVNPSGGGVNRARETFEGNAVAHTHDPEGVAKYVEEVDSYEEARTKQSDSDAQVDRAVGAGEGSSKSTPAPAKAKKSDSTDV